MDVMLDTCGLLSLVGLAEKKLSRKTCHAIEEAEEVYISSASLFELALKHKKGALSLGPFEDSELLWQTAIQEYDLTELSVSAKAFHAAVQLPDHHADPFDRIIIAQAMHYDAAIVTFDRVFPSYGVNLLS